MMKNNVKSHDLFMYFSHPLSLKLLLLLVATAAKRLSMLEEIEKEFEGTNCLKQVLSFTKKSSMLLKKCMFLCSVFS